MINNATEKILIRAPHSLKLIYVNRAKELGLTLNSILLNLMWENADCGIKNKEELNENSKRNYQK